jgi:hypothetical protein
MTLLLVTIHFASTHCICVRTHHQLTLGTCSSQAAIIIKEKLIAQETMSILKITFTITKEDATAEHADVKRNRRKEMDNAITYAGAIYMIMGWTIGRVIAILIIDRLEKKNDK